MAPTIGRQWRGETQDYAALCDYCDVRYLRSQLHKQGNGRLACWGPGTNSCGAGQDEVALDKINADIMRNRRRPTRSRGGRFDRVLSSIEDIFGTTLQEYWDARVGVTSSTLGAVSDWEGRKLGATLVPGAGGAAFWNASSDDFFGRPAVSVTAAEFASDTAPLFPSGGRPYIGLVARHVDDRGGAVQFFNGVDFQAVINRDVDGGLLRGTFKSAAVPAGTELPIPVDEVGNVRRGRLYELDATGPLTFRAGKAEASTNVVSQALTYWSQVTVQAGLELTLLVLADNPTAAQIDLFRALGRSYGGSLG